MRIEVLGEARAHLDDGQVDLRTLKQRAFLAALALTPGERVSADRLVDLVWSGSPPESTTATLQTYIARLRRDLEPERPPRAAPRYIRTVPGGYLLDIRRRDLDSTAFEDEVLGVHHVLSIGGRPLIDDAAGLLARLQAALATWRGTPFLELGDGVDVQTHRARWEEVRLVAREDAAALGLTLGREATVAGELAVLVAAHPFRERLWELRAVALARCGRQAEALAAMQEVHRVFDVELGLEPGPELRALHEAILRQDPEVMRRPSTGPVLLGMHSGPTAASDGAADRHRAAPTPRWGFVGRERERSALSDLLTAVTGGGPLTAVVTGEPGVGVSRLCDELSASAGKAGFRVLRTACSATHGSSPLGPWAEVLSQLGSDLPVVEDTGGDRFQAREWIVGMVVSDTDRRPTLLVLEDLDDADTSTLQVLRMLIQDMAHARLVLVVTWRATPHLSGPLAEIADALARRHALRIELSGLDDRDTALLAHAVTQRAVDSGEAESLRRRTDGNPFFIVELCRATTEAHPTAALDHADPPAPVREVLERRLTRLAPAIRDVLTHAAVAGRTFDLASVIISTGRDEDDVLTDLDISIASGVIVEESPSRYRFTHALMREVLYADLSQTRRARLHARLAVALEGRPRREGEVARHWLAAGDDHADRAWPAAVEAAEWAIRVHAVDEAIEMLHAAADSATAARADPSQLFDIVLLLAGTLQQGGSWADLRPVIHRGVELALHLADLDRLVEITVLPLTGAIWQAAGHGHVDSVVVDALRYALARLPRGDGPARCRVQLALAGELYYAPEHSVAERELLVDGAIAMARRLDDDALLLWSLVTGATATWRAATARARLARLEEAVELARARPHTSDSQVLSAALTLRATALMELGRIPQMERAAVEARREAQRCRHTFGLLALSSMSLPWAAMREQHHEVRRAEEEISRLSARVGMFDDGPSAVMAVRALWTDDTDLALECADVIEATGPLPSWHFCAVLRLRAGRMDLARAGLARAADHLPLVGSTDVVTTLDLDLIGDVWYSPLAWASAAEVALALGDPILGAWAAGHLRGLEGTPAHSGSISFGPVDAFAAMAAEATGDRASATIHADAAVRLFREWRIPLALRWFQAVRTTHRF